MCVCVGGGGGGVHIGQHEVGRFVSIKIKKKYCMSLIKNLEMSHNANSAMFGKYQFLVCCIS